MIFGPLLHDGSFMFWINFYHFNKYTKIIKILTHTLISLESIYKVMYLKIVYKCYNYLLDALSFSKKRHMQDTNDPIVCIGDPTTESSHKQFC